MKIGFSTECVDPLYIHIIFLSFIYIMASLSRNGIDLVRNILKDTKKTRFHRKKSIFSKSGEIIHQKGTGVKLKKKKANRKSTVGAYIFFLTDLYHHQPL